MQDITHLFIYISFASMAILFLPVLAIQFKILAMLKKYEIDFFNNIPSGFFTKAQNLPFIILFGKYRDIKSNKIKKLCTLVRLLQIIYLIFFISCFLGISYLAYNH